MSNVLSVIAAPRRTTRQSLLAAGFFAIQLGLAAVLLSAAYTFFQKPGATWAIISSVLVLYPGINQSFAASLLRIVANLIGGITGLAIGHYMGTAMPQVILALTIVIFIGELLRLDLALRTACVAVIIVMTANDHNVTLSAVERIIAVIAGCGAAIAIQALFHPFERFLPFIAHTEISPNTPMVTNG